MNNKRAKEIVSSPIMAKVTYNGTPVYIEKINSDNTTANVHPLDQPGKSQRVDLSNLIEH